MKRAEDYDKALAQLGKDPRINFLDESWLDHDHLLVCLAYPYKYPNGDTEASFTSPERALRAMRHVQVDQELLQYVFEFDNEIVDLPF